MRPARTHLLLCPFRLSAPRPVSGLLVSSRFVSFFVSEDKPTVRSRRSRRPTAYTRTRQLLRTTRHIVYGSPLGPSRSRRLSPSLWFTRSRSVSPSFSRSFTLSLVLSRARPACIRYLQRGAIRRRRQFPSSDKVYIAVARERSFPTTENGCVSQPAENRNLEEIVNLLRTTCDVIIPVFSLLFSLFLSVIVDYWVCYYYAQIAPLIGRSIQCVRLEYRKAVTWLKVIAIYLHVA